MTKAISLHAGIHERVFYNDIYIKVLDVHLEFAKNENLEELCSIEVVDTQDLKERPSTVTRQRRGRMIESGTAMALNSNRPIGCDNISFKTSSVLSHKTFFLQNI